MRNWMRWERRKKKMTQKEVAQCTGVSPQYYGLIESGARQRKLHIDMVIKLADVFQISVDAILQLEMRGAEGHDN